MTSPSNPFNFDKNEEKDNSNEKKGQPLGPMQNWSNSGPLTWLILFVVFMFLGRVFNPGTPTNQVNYSQFKTWVREGRVAKVSIGKELITGELSDGQLKRFKTQIPPIIDDQLYFQLEQSKVIIEANQQDNSVWTAVLINFLPWVIILGFFYYSSRRLNKSMGQFPGSQLLPKKDVGIEVEKIDVKFTDVAGVENAKKDLVEVVDFLKCPDKYTKLGADLPKGVLMMGPPGTGKTLLARAVAGEADVPFFSMSGSEFIELYVGMGASRVRTLFEKAQERAPSIIFIDEIDSIGRSRGTGLGGGHDEREQTLNQILSEMDGLTKSGPVIVLAATNRPDVLDNALTRPGRFDRQVMLDLPLVRSREKILTIHTRKVPLDDKIQLKELAKGTPGFSGADLKNLVNEAALCAAREGDDKVGKHHFDEARDKILMGNPREEILLDKHKEVIAVHEAGHALVALLTKGSDPVKKITIVPRGRALGFTEQGAEEDQVNITKTYLLGTLAVLLGGRAAEELVFNESTTGAENDLKRATTLARKMIINWGMGEKLGSMAFDLGEDHPFLGREIARPKNFSEKTAEIIDDEIHQILEERKSYVRALLENHRDKLHLISGELMRKETLDEKEIHELIGGDLPTSENHKQ
jgi:cell division protease FtsH